jgi:hypothetical protein
MFEIVEPKVCFTEYLCVFMVYLLTMFHVGLLSSNVSLVIPTTRNATCMFGSSTVLSLYIVQYHYQIKFAFIENIFVNKFQESSLSVAHTLDFNMAAMLILLMI